jgi:amino acid adenylation domain-containing protein/non-ribosomal peptide synthase protein (TIGR01720 family)
MRLENVEDIYPLAPLQQGLLFHSLSAPEAGLYCNQALFTLSGKLNVPAFKRAWQRVVDHHPVLRTSFVWEGVKEPVQVVNRKAEFSLAHHDWREESPEAQRGNLEKIFRADLEQGFDLAQTPLLRGALLQTADERHEFLWNFHHILMDGWSMFQVLHEAFASYEAYTRGEEYQLARPRPYRDYIAWLRRQSAALAEAFWRKYFKGFTAPTPLVVDRLAESKIGDEFASQLLALSAETTDALEAMAQKHHLTLNTLMQGAWALLLSRYSGEEDVVFGAILSGRPAELNGVETMVGLFINTLPVRVQASPREALLDWLKKNQTQQAEMRQYEYSALSHVQAWSDAPPGSSLFESIFMFENYRKERPLEEMGASVKIGNARWFERQNYPLAAIAIPGRPTVLRLTYDCRRFEGETIARMLRHWQTLLEGMTSNPTRRLCELPLLAREEEQQLLVRWNDTALNFPRERCAHEFFEAQAQQRPEAIAVSHQGRALTYRELNRRANQLANHLSRHCGIGPEVLVGICMERSLESVLAGLAVLKAGGAFVPLDPAYPPERLAFMLQDAQAPVLLTKQFSIEKFQLKIENLKFSNLKLICLDTDWAEIAKESSETPGSSVTPENLAYVIYTSGSTGKPKGVKIPHAGLVNLCAWHQHAYQIAANDRATQVAAPAFDASVWELWPYLTAGASVHIPDEETPGNPAQLLEWLAAEAITICFIPTPIAEAVLEEPLPNHLALRALLVGGDKLHRRPRQMLPFILANNYGPTENTVVTTWTPVFVDPDSGERSRTAPPIGKPVSNTQIFILERNQQPVPVGVPGELHISGESLARGYLNRPELTAEKFIPNPFAQLRIADYGLGNQDAAIHNPHSTILYKTGDLVRYLPDGNIEFLGRIDHQVKIRGNRIELGEIETALLQYPAVREAVCVVRDEASGNKRLLAYVVAHQNFSPSSSELGNFLKSKLPDYMAPSAFVFLSALPLTQNGKVDRQALPAPERTEPEREDAFVAPSTPLEKNLAEIWAEVLRVEKVGLHDNFFELGGDSILTIQIISRANRAGIKITPKQLFTHPTIAELAGVINTAPTAENEQGMIAGVVPLTPIQHWFFEQNFVEPQHWNMAMRLEASRALDAVILQQTVQHLLAHHDVLRLRFVKTESGWQQSYPELEGAEVPFVRIDLSSFSDGEQKAAIKTKAAELQASLDLSKGPLLRVALFERGTSQPSVLLIVIHHLVFDGVSWRILLEDLETVYQQLSRDEKIQLPPKTTSFKQWAWRLAEHAQSEKLQNEIDFWLNQARLSLAHDAAAAIPVDFAGGRKANTMASSRTVSITLSVAETQALLQDAPKTYRAQIDEVLLTALLQTFSRWTGENSLLINLEGHGREDILEGVEMSRTVGWFTTMFPVCLKLENAEAAGEALKEIKEQLRRIPNRGIGFGLLRYLCRNKAITEKLCAIPQPEVSFNYLGQFDQVLPKSASFKIVQGDSGPVCNPQAKGYHLLEITGMIMHDCLQVEWMYGAQVHRQATIEKLAQNFLAALRALIEHCQNAEAAGYTPSDFPGAKLSQKDLDKLLGKIRQPVK